MVNQNFKDYKRTYLSAIRNILDDTPPGIFNEAAFPAYSHRNPIINFIFWQRIRIAMNYIEHHGPYEKGLDFGCGSGVMLPIFVQNCAEVIGMDIDLSAIRKIKS